MDLSMTHERIEQTFSEESGRVLAALVSSLHDLELAEDSLQDALIIALERWPVEGVPPNPGAWLTLAAKRKAIDRLRRNAALDQKTATLKALAELEQEDETMDIDSIPDDRLKLIFTCCHPALAIEAQIALTLQTLGGLTTPEIAAAFLVPVPTMAQRLVRAKRKIKDAGIPYQIPPVSAIPERLDAVLSALYLIFNAGYEAPTGEALIRHDLCAEAIRLTRILSELLADNVALGADAETLGLLALMLLHHSRRNARVDVNGNLILLEDQDRTFWDQAEIAEGIALLDRAMTTCDSGPYQIQAAISALHAQALRFEDTDWVQIVALYSALLQMSNSPVVALNRAVAVAMAEGINAGLQLLDELEDAGDLNDYYLFHAARADLLRRARWLDESRSAYIRALDLCQNQTERSFLSRRLAEVEQALR